MSENQNFSFGKFIPGFDFLQDLAKGASTPLPQMPNLSNWVAPTLNLEELEKRIGELKAVHFWLDQNSKALGATIQALEVQRMTLATLKGMNFNMGEVADALRLKPDTLFAGSAKSATPGNRAPASPSPAPAVEPTAKPKPGHRAGKTAKGENQPAAGVVDPLQWWGALTRQFQQIASEAMKDVAAQTTADGAAPQVTPKGDAGNAARSGAAKKTRPARRSARKSSNA